ncbi:MAG: L-threonylcarbamoyladenylate synthase [Candidatus Kapaibacterium sp.]
MRTIFLNATESFEECTDILQAAQMLRNGDLVAFPTETVYGLGADAFNAESIEKIFIAKGRPSDNPLIVHVASFQDIELVGEINSRVLKLAEKFMPGPLTIIINSNDKIPLIARAGLPTVGVRIPNHKVAYELLRNSGPLVGPSANLSTMPSPTNASHVLNDLNGRINGILNGGECSMGIESTIIDTTTKELVLLRPGIISLEEIESTLQEKVVFSNNGDKFPKAPGMKYKHYSPKTKVSLIFDDEEIPKEKLNRIVITTDKHKPKFPNETIFNLSESSLYKYLRLADDLRMNEVIIYTQKNEITIGLLDRILKAGGRYSREN